MCHVMDLAALNPAVMKTIPGSSLRTGAKRKQTVNLINYRLQQWISISCPKEDRN